MTGSIHIRRAADFDVPALLDVQSAAAARFGPLKIIATADNLPDPIPARVFERAAGLGLLFAAELEQQCVGFALCSVQRPDLYLDQLSVIPAAGRRGAGAQLLQAVYGEACRRGLWGVMLSTFRDVPWNGPFFAKQGFGEVPRAGLALWQLDIERAQSAIMDVGARCFMRRPTNLAKPLAA